MTVTPEKVRAVTAEIESALMGHDAPAMMAWYHTGTGHWMLGRSHLDCTLCAKTVPELIEKARAMWPKKEQPQLARQRISEAAKTLQAEGCDVSRYQIYRLVQSGKCRSWESPCRPTLVDVDELRELFGYEEVQRVK